MPNAPIVVAGWFGGLVVAELYTEADEVNFRDDEKIGAASEEEVGDLFGNVEGETKSVGDVNTEFSVERADTMAWAGEEGKGDGDCGDEIYCMEEDCCVIRSLESTVELGWAEGEARP